MNNCHADKGAEQALTYMAIIHFILYISYFIHNFPIVNITFLAIKVYTHFCNRQV